MQLERRALYNLLRMNWLLDPTLDLEPWQIEDYRLLPHKTLFDQLHALGIDLDKTSFLSLSETHDTPESLLDELLNEDNFNAEDQDQAYLIIFELWRRLVPEKSPLSIFCDELDYQIHLYDKVQPETSESIQDILANLQVILDENVDQGANKTQVFERVSSECANDLESFLYDFIAEQIDNQNYSYASELLDGFSGYIKETKWFDFLRARILTATDAEGAYVLLKQIVKDAEKKKDLEYNLEILSCMVQAGEKDLFVKLVKQTVPLLKIEDDFKDLLAICADYYRCLDQEQEESMLLKLLKTRDKTLPESTVNRKDPAFADLFKIVV
jgi:hypothetical protein